MGTPEWLERLEQAAKLPMNPLINDTVIVRREDLRQAIKAIDQIPPADEDPEVL